MPSELTDSHKATRKAPQPRRGRLIKPKPNLRCSSRPPQSQQVDSVPAEAGVKLLSVVAERPSQSMALGR